MKEIEKAFSTLLDGEKNRHWMYAWGPSQRGFGWQADRLSCFSEPIENAFSV